VRAESGADASDLGGIVSRRTIRTNCLESFILLFHLTLLHGVRLVDKVFSWFSLLNREVGGPRFCFPPFSERTVKLYGFFDFVERGSITVDLVPGGKKYNSWPLAIMLILIHIDGLVWHFV
jgi:hypothetical protein